MIKSVNANEFHEIHDSHQFRSILKELMDRHRITPTELARRINLPQPTIHRLLVGKTEDPRLSTLSLISEYFSVSIDQLLGVTALEEINNQNKLANTRTLPIISWQDAVKENFTKTLTTTNWDNWFFVEANVSPLSFGLVSKHSAEPRIPTGSILTVDPNTTPEDGDLVIVYYENTAEATIRQIILDGLKQILVSIINPSISDELLPSIKIIGVIVQTRFSYK